jgi:hypothetical protein
MGFFDDEYQYGEDDYVDKKIRLILKVDPSYLNDFHYRHNRYPRSEEIMQEFAVRSSRGDFYYVDNTREELDIAHERRRQKELENRDSDSSGADLAGTVIGGLFYGLAMGAAYIYNQFTDDDEDEYYQESSYYEEDDDDGWFF